MPIKKYKKKPVVIEAIQLIEDNQQEVFDFCEGKAFLTIDNTLYIPTLEGKLIATQGDYIIKGVAGEFYPCKPDIFEKTYELVEDDSEDYVAQLYNLIKVPTKLGCNFLWECPEDSCNPNCKHFKDSCLAIPKLTAEKLYHTISYLSQALGDISCKYLDNRFYMAFEGLTFYHSDPEQAFAGFLVKLWKNLTREQRQRINGIFKEDVR